jgi:hypothetical protein
MVMFSRQASWKRHRRTTFARRIDLTATARRTGRIPPNGLGLRPVCALSCSAANDISTAFMEAGSAPG